MKNCKINNGGNQVKTRRILGILVPVLILTLMLGACDTINGNGASNGVITGSGTIGAREVKISSVLGGTVAEAPVQEGQYVNEGDFLFRTDDDLLQAQRDQVLASVEVGRASLRMAQVGLENALLQYDMILNGARMEAAPLNEQAWRIPLPSDFTLPEWYFQHSEKIDSAQLAVEAAEEALETERASLDQVLGDTSNADVEAAEKRLLEAQMAYIIAEDVRDRARQARERDEIEDYADSLFDAAETELEAAQSTYDRVLSDVDADELLEARARLAVSQAGYDSAILHLNLLRTGEYSLPVEAAAKGLEMAEAAVAQAEAGLGQAEAALAAIETSLEKVEVLAPSPGTVLVRNLEFGETIAPGAVVITIADLDEVSLTVCVPEDRYGEIRLGQEVIITVDSFPNREFTGTVESIADKAEFTPRNVQTVDGRRSTVYAIKIRMLNPEGMLKPGMPADAVFVGVY